MLAIHIILVSDKPQFIMYSKIFNIGLSRTGTTFSHEVLEKLGFKSTHFVNALLKNDWEVVDNYDALGDTPIPLLFKECDKRYPNSKFILTTRNKDKWLNSMKWMFKHGRIIWNWPLSLGNYHRNIYGTNRFNQEILDAAFERHHMEVRDYFKDRPDDFLEINIEDGFNIEEICTFLEITPRPVQIIHTNDRRKAKTWQFLNYYLWHYLIYPIANSTKKILMC